MKIQSQAFKENGNGSLAPAVSGGFWQATISRQTRNCHQLPATALNHSGNYRGDRINHADDVDINQSRDLFRVEILCVRRGPNSRIRKQEVDWAKLRTQLVNRIAYRRRVGNITRTCQRRSPS